MFGGAVHHKLINGEGIDVDQIPHILNADGDIVDLPDVDGDQFVQALLQFGDFPPDDPEPLVHPFLNNPPIIHIDDDGPEAEVVSDSSSSNSLPDDVDDLHQGDNQGHDQDDDEDSPDEEWIEVNDDDIEMVIDDNNWEKYPQL